MSKWKELVAAAALSFATTTAMADGVPGGSVKDAPAAEPKRDWTLTANFALTTDYVFRGFSQSAQSPTVQAGVDFTYKLFYMGLWGSGIDFGQDASRVGRDIAHVEVDLYAGIKPVVGKATFDLGVIYYTYPNSFTNNTTATFRDLNYVELKAGVSYEAWKDGTLGFTAFWSPNYTNDTGSVVTLEGTVAQVLPKLRDITPTFSALLGYQAGDDTRFTTLVGNGSSDYLYWNAGMALGFGDNFSVDLRYWDTNINNANKFCSGSTFQCDERFVVTAKVTY